MAFMRPDRDAALFRETVDGICGPLDLEILGAATGDRPGPDRVEVAQLSSCRVSRLAMRAHRMRAPRRSGGDDVAIGIKLLFQVSGTQRLKVGSRTYDLRPGHWAFFDPVGAYSTECEGPICQLLVEIPRDSFRPQLLAQIKEPRVYPPATLCPPIALLIRAALDQRRPGPAPAPDPLDDHLDDTLRAMCDPFMHRLAQDFGLAAAPDELLRGRFIACVERRLHDPALSIDEIAHKLGCSRRHLFSTFQRIGISPAQQIREQRLARAQALLRRPPAVSGPIASIAFACGFQSAPHFTRAFKERFGHTPARQRSLAAHPAVM